MALRKFQRTGTPRCAPIVIAAWMVTWLLLSPATGMIKAYPLDVSDAEAHRIARRIFQNECAGSRDCLLSWNRHEDFMSLGIGHFIWYPPGVSPHFLESFPLLVRFLAHSGVAPPAAAGRPGGGVAPCPWPDRQSFETDRDGSTAAALRDYLEATMDGQARFMLRRLEAAWPVILRSSPEKDRRRVERHFSQLARTPMGRYALVDYVNFKGEGTFDRESIGGHGWGLLQVLLEMDPAGSGEKPLAAFAVAADRVLTRRAVADVRSYVKDQWLPGWRRRLATYLEPRL